MSVFTDDKLRAFKRRAEQFPTIDISGNVMLALLARLEAAENCVESLDDLLHHGTVYPNGAQHEANPEVAIESLEAWKKSAGKEGGRG